MAFLFLCLSQWRKSYDQEERKNLIIQFKDTPQHECAVSGRIFGGSLSKNLCQREFGDSTEKRRILWRNFAILKASNISECSAGKELFSGS